MTQVIENSLGVRMPVATRVLIDCEVPSCMEYTYGYYTTCEKHTRMLEKAGVTIRFSRQNSWVYNNYEATARSDTLFDFRFSASYASRYNNCHGSANLEKAIPDFVYPEDNEGGMKGEGSRLHKIFEEALRNPDRLRDVGVLLREVAKIWGPKRTAFVLQSELKYVTGWFLRHKTEPPLELSTLKEGLYQKIAVLNPDRTHKHDENGVPIWTESAGTPRRIEFLADALDYAADIWESLDPETREIFVEEKRVATWLQTKPKTTVDLIMRDKNVTHVLDLKMGDIQVRPFMNEQLMYYYQTFRRPEDSKVVLHIMQRKYTDDWTLPIKVLDEWVARVQASEQAIMDGDLTLTAGSHCTFCPANPGSRGDKGNKACPVQLEVMFGRRDREQSDESVVNDGDDYNDE
jgi:hypothetical protein